MSSTAIFGSKAKFAEDETSSVNEPTKQSPAKKRKVVIITPRPLNSRRQKISAPISRRHFRTTNFKRPIKPKLRGPVPKLLPAQRRKEIGLVEDSDTDVLSITEDINIETVDSGRGRLLRLSTLKPRRNPPEQVIGVDPIPEGSVDATKRIVRIVKRPSKPTSLNIELPQTTKEVGIQFGIPLGEYLKRKRESAPPPSANQEPPLQGYWTHKVNLPYPPQQQQHNQPQFAIAPTPPQPFVQQPQQAFTQAPDGNWIACAQPQVVYLPQQSYQTGSFANRRQRRNFFKSQKQHQRRTDRKAD